MTNFLQPFMSGHGESNEQYLQQTEQGIRELQVEINETAADQNQARMEQLIHTGFSWEEAMKLMGMREHVYENSEMLQRMENDPRIQFVRWLIAHDEINER